MGADWMREQFRESMRERYRGEMARGLGIPTAAVEISDQFAAYLMARDLMEGDPEQQKAGYTATNAILAVVEVFPDIDRDRLDDLLGAHEVVGRMRP